MALFICYFYCFSFIFNKIVSRNNQFASNITTEKQLLKPMRRVKGCGGVSEGKFTTNKRPFVKVKIARVSYFSFLFFLVFRLFLLLNETRKITSTAELGSSHRYNKEPRKSKYTTPLIWHRRMYSNGEGKKKVHRKQCHRYLTISQLEVSQSEVGVIFSPKKQEREKVNYFLWEYQAGVREQTMACRSSVQGYMSRNSRLTLLLPLLSLCAFLFSSL